MNIRKIIIVYGLSLIFLLLIADQFKHDCADFFTKAGAQRKFNSNPDMYKSMDRDHDNKVCE